MNTALVKHTLPPPPVMQLYRQGWHEIPEVMASSYMMLAGKGMGKQVGLEVT